MTPFPHFAPLPVATPQQAALIYSLLHVTPRIVRFDRLTSALALIADAYILLLYWLLLATGQAARIRDWVERHIPRGLYQQIAVTYLVVSAALVVAGLPLSVVRGWVIPHAYGLTNESVWRWLWDHTKAVGIDTVIGASIAGLLALIIRRYPRKWPYAFAAALTPIIAFGIFLEPLLVDPLFNQFTPLSQSSHVYSPLRQLTQEAGVGQAAIYVVDKSRQTNETNAYVTGFGPSLRIVIWDTLLKQMDTREVVAVIGHELGHYVEGHLVIGFALTVIGLFVLFPLIRRLALFWLARCGPRWGLRPTLYDPAALPLLLLCLNIAFLATQPVSNLCSRWIEHRADAYSLGLVRDRVGLARGFVDLSKQNLDNPYPPLWEKLWFDDHPPLGERIRYALNGQP